MKIKCPKCHGYGDYYETTSRRMDNFPDYRANTTADMGAGYEAKLVVCSMCNGKRKIQLDPPKKSQFTET